MKIVFIGCVDFSYNALRTVLEEDYNVVGIVTRKASAFNADFKSLEELGRKYEIPLFFAAGNNQEAMAQWIEELSPQVIFCFGWSYLLKKKVLTLAPMGVIGYHPAKLPQNRGRHPIIWALVLGLEETASTFFFMDEGADSGDILSQEPVEIDETDRASTLYERITQKALVQIRRFLPQLKSGRYPRIPQDHDSANYWRKRSKKDGLIDWRMPAKGIVNLVRALAKPYVGAHCEYGGNEVKIWNVQEEKVVAENMEPGKILKVDGSRVWVKCGDSGIIIMEHEFVFLPSIGEYL